MGSDHPILQLDHLDTLWFQVAGTLCNLRCKHCFISCSPENHTLDLMSFDQILPYLEEAVHLGVKEFYFTGGEPFINPDLPKILEATLRIGPATVLSNATLFSAELVKELAAMRDSSKIRSNCASASTDFHPRPTTQSVDPVHLSAPCGESNFCWTGVFCRSSRQCAVGQSNRMKLSSAGSKILWLTWDTDIHGLSFYCR